MRVVALNGPTNPQIGIYSFSSQDGAQPNAQFEFDVSSFRDPKGQKQFNTSHGTAYGICPDVRDWVGQDRRMPAIIEMCQLLAEDLIRPRKHGEVTEPISPWLSISFKDFHGKWIAPAVAEVVANRLSEDGFVVVAIHHNLPKEALSK